jgi:hypothetical protein
VEVAELGFGLIGIRAHEGCGRGPVLVFEAAAEDYPTAIRDRSTLVNAQRDGIGSGQGR